MHILITGGTGFIGLHIAYRLSKQGHQVTLFDNLPSRKGKLPAHPFVRLVQGDIRDQALLVQILRSHAIERVIHTAAIPGIISSIDQPLQTVQINVEGALQLFEAARIVGVERIVDLSSEEIYGPLCYEPVDERHPLAPINPYAITKQSVEQFGAYYAGQGYFQYVAVRLCWVYGPRYPRLRLPRTLLIDAILGRRTILHQGGDQRLDLTYIDDAVIGICRVVEAPAPAHSVYNISSGKAYSVAQIAALIQRLVPAWSYDIGPGLLQLEDRYTLSPKGALDITRARTELGYHPSWSLEDGLAAELASLREELAEEYMG